MSHRVDVEQSHRVSEVTIAYYDRMAEAYWDGTRDHDVSQNYTAFLDAIENDPPYSILDLGCGPGRDLHHFRLFGHNAVGLDGSPASPPSETASDLADFHQREGKAHGFAGKGREIGPALRSDRTLPKPTCVARCLRSGAPPLRVT